MGEIGVSFAARWVRLWVSGILEPDLLSRVLGHFYASDERR